MFSAQSAEMHLRAFLFPEEGHNWAVESIDESQLEELKQSNVLLEQSHFHSINDIDLVSSFLFVCFKMII